MPSTRFICLPLTAVAAFGLASCSPDGGGRAPAPGISGGSLEYRRPLRNVLVRPSGTDAYPLDVWGKTTDHRAQITGVIDVEADKPEIVEIVATCSNGDQPQLVRTTRFERATRIPMFKVLPEDLLTRDLRKVPVSCNFNVQLSHDGQVKYSNPFLADFTADAGDLTLEGPAPDPASATVLLNAHRLQGVRIRAGRDARLARLICGDADFPAIHVGEVIDLNSFLIDHPVIRSGHQIGVPLTDRPDQTCRVAVYDRDLQSPDAITRVFLLNFDSGSWRIKKHDLDSVHRGLLLAHVDVPLADYVVTNLEDRARAVRVNQAQFATELSINLSPETNTVEAVSLPWTRVYRDRPEGLVPLEKDESFVIPARGSIRLQIRFFAPTFLLCHHSRVRARLLDEIYLQDLAPNGMVMTSTPLPSPARRTIVVANPDYVFDEAEERAGSAGCFSESPYVKI